MALSFFPQGQDGAEKPLPGLLLDSRNAVTCTAFYRTDTGNYLLRLFNPLDTPEAAAIRIPALHIEDTAVVPPYEFITREYYEQK